MGDLKDQFSVLAKVASNAVSDLILCAAPWAASAEAQSVLSAVSKQIPSVIRDLTKKLDKI